MNNIKEFPFEAKADRRKKIIEEFSTLTIGMNKEEVKNKLGVPDAEFFSYDTTKGKSFLGSSWGYYLRRHEAEYANDKYDQVVFIYFSPDEKLYWAKPDNIEVLCSKGGPYIKKR